VQAAESPCGWATRARPGGMGARMCGRRGPQVAAALVLGCASLLSLAGLAAAGAAAAVASGGVAPGLGLRGGRELEQETRRKPFDENAEPADVLLKDWKKKGAQTPTALESLLGETLLKQAGVDRCAAGVWGPVCSQCMPAGLMTPVRCSLCSADPPRSARDARKARASA
jgi:hypothetical protein